MQTFLLDKDYKKSFQMLDSKRLNKQLLESLQIAQYLTNKQFLHGKFNPNAPHSKHPAVKMWKLYKPNFYFYMKANSQELINRGLAINSHMHDAVDAYFNYIAGTSDMLYGNVQPLWLTNEFIKRHQIALLYKSFVKYISCKISLVNNMPMKNVTSSYQFLSYVMEHNHINDFDNLPKYTNKNVASWKMIENADKEYSQYRANFHTIGAPYYVDYLWG